jgi:hypothetical protein
MKHYVVLIHKGIFDFLKFRFTAYLILRRKILASGAFLNIDSRKKITIIQTNVYSKSSEELSKFIVNFFKGVFIEFRLSSDEDVWEYTLFKNGMVWDKFSTNPYPNLEYDMENEWYYDGMDMSAKLDEWKGNPQKMIEIFPNVDIKTIEKYYNRSYWEWEENETKSYSNDQFTVGDYRQFYDFVKRLGLSIKQKHS